MTTVNEIYNYIDEFAPFDTALPGDNVGLLVGGNDEKVTRCGVCLDITPDIICEAIDKKINLIICHHSFIYEPLKTILKGSVPYELAAAGINAIAAHTNLDACDGGVNDCLCEKLGLQSVKKFADADYPDFPQMGRYGELPRVMSVPEFAAYSKEKLGSEFVRFNDIKRTIKQIGVCCGGGTAMLKDAINLRFDAFLTGDARHHEWISLNDGNIAMIECGHHITENVIVKPLAKKLAKQFPKTDVIILEQDIPYLEV